MPLSDIIRLQLDTPAMTPQQVADQVLIADRTARMLARTNHPDAEDARTEADALADAFNQRFN